MRPSLLLLFGAAALLVSRGALAQEGTSQPAVSSAAPTTPAAETTPASASSAPPPRFALGLGHKHAFLPRSISHDAIAATLELRPGPRVSLALAAAVYAPFDQPYAKSPASWPLNRTLGTAGIEMKGFVAGGHEKELYVLGAAGVIGTKPVALRDPWRRTFGYEARISFSMGLGGRIRISRQVAAFAEARLTSYVDNVENGSVVLDGEPAISRNDQSTWFGDKRLVSMVETQLGLLVFLGR